MDAASLQIELCTRSAAWPNHSRSNFHLPTNCRAYLCSAAMWQQQVSDSIRCPGQQTTAVNPASMCDLYPTRHDEYENSGKTKSNIGVNQFNTADDCN